MNAIAVRPTVAGSLARVAQDRGIQVADVFLEVELVAVVDISGSMNNRTDSGGTRAKLAQEHLTRLQAEYPGRIALVEFNGRPHYVPEGTLGQSSGSTNLADALKFVQPADAAGIKVVIISDGEPNKPQAALDLAAGFNRRLHTVFIGDEGAPGHKFLEDLARVSGGGMAFRVSDVNLYKPLTCLLDSPAGPSHKARSGARK